MAVGKGKRKRMLVDGVNMFQSIFRHLHVGIPTDVAPNNSIEQHQCDALEPTWCRKIGTDGIWYLYLPETTTLIEHVRMCPNMSEFLACLLNHF